MTYTDLHNGRLCNQIIRNLAVSLIAEKHNLRVNYCNNSLMEQLGLMLFSGHNSYDNTIPLTDDNYFSILNQDVLQSNLDPNKNYFQTNSIIKGLYSHIHCDRIKNNIISKNPFNDRYNTNNDIYVHVRLGDVIRHNPGAKYYINAISGINHDNVYISTDYKDHEIFKEIIESYPNAIVLEYEEIQTIQFASTCKHIILSNGTFSATIGYLSFFSNINFPKYNTNGNWWHGDIFSIEGWNGIYVENFTDVCP